MNGSMKLYKTKAGILLESKDHFYPMGNAWDELINREHLYDHLNKWVTSHDPDKNINAETLDRAVIMAPVGTQEIWAAGVTYIRSRNARMEESKDSGGSDFYQKVYEAQRPELFFKALPHRVAAHNEEVYIRRDSAWNVPEPELTLYINSFGTIQGYTIGNDMSSRDIEGENPLYLPQAKIYERSAALGPCLLVPEHPLSGETSISITINREKKAVFEDSIRLNRMKRSFTELAAYLFRECIFDKGVFLMTGTGMVPPPDFTLETEDEVSISIEGIGTLNNKVASKKAFESPRDNSIGVVGRI